MTDILLSLVMKSLTRAQLESRKAKAVWFTRDVRGDSNRADEIEAESLEDYAQQRKIALINTSKRRHAIMAKTPTKADLQQQIDDLQDENQDLQDQLDAVADIVAPADDEEDDEYDPDFDDSTGDEDQD